MAAHWNPSQRTISQTTYNNLVEHDHSKIYTQSRPDGWKTSKASTPETVDGYSTFVSEAIDRSIAYDLLNNDDIRSYDPAAIVALPRLALLVAMLDYSWSTMKWEHDPRWILTKREDQEAITSGKHWFRNRESQMKALAVECQDMATGTRLELEQALVNGQGGQVFKQICALADNLMISSSSFCKMLQSSIDMWKSKMSEEEIESLFI
ncbi:hypothetical protein Unana1_08813 [Umbelopsis nana]